jgi:hypothetical protein
VVGGIKSVYFVDFGDFGTIAYDATNSDAIETIAGTPTAFQYDVKGNSSFTQNVNSSRENGTTFYEQVLELTFTKLDKQSHKELKLMAFGRPHVFVEDYNGNIFLMGLEFGAEITGGTIVTGAAMGDLSGYTLSLTAQEKIPANFLDADLATVGITVSATQIAP